jgi:hypothetical protein
MPETMKVNQEPDFGPRTVRVHGSLLVVASNLIPPRSSGLVCQASFRRGRIRGIRGCLRR